MRELRSELDKLLLQKIAQPTLDIGGHPVIGTIVSLLAKEGAQ